MNTRTIFVGVFLAFSLVVAGCGNNDHNDNDNDGGGTPQPTPEATATMVPDEPTPTPTPTGADPVPTATPDTSGLVSERVSSAPSGIDDPLWDTIAPFAPTLSTVSSNLLYGDGQLNMNGTFSGLTDFNGGAPGELWLRSVHDGNKIYILAQWNDTVFNLDRRRWLYDGPTDPLKPGESADGWTSQLNDDKIGLAFDITPASSEFGTFADVGCAASCHNVNGEGLDMRPAEGKVDIWHWKTSRSEPLGYVDDQNSTPDNGRKDDAGAKMENRNRPDGGDNRSGPEGEWDGTTQDFTRWDGGLVMLDPAYILLGTHMMSFDGDAAAGDTTYQASCAVCHGPGGGGGIGPALTPPGFTGESRSHLADEMAAVTHPGAAAWNGLSAPEQTDVFARLRGFSGVPGYYLTQPDGSLADVVTQSNVDYTMVEDSDLMRVDYQLLMIRNLNTGNDDDAQFTPGENVVFGVALMDNDGRNHIGSTREVLSIAP